MKVNESNPEQYVVEVYDDRSTRMGYLNASGTVVKEPSRFATKADADAAADAYNHAHLMSDASVRPA